MGERDLRKVEMAVRFRLAPKFEIRRFYPLSHPPGRSLLLFPVFRVTPSLLPGVSPSGDHLKKRIGAFRAIANHFPFDQSLRKIASPARKTAA
jgi:hypothetical protein